MGGNNQNGGRRSNEHGLGYDGWGGVARCVTEPCNGFGGALGSAVADAHDAVAQLLAWHALCHRASGRSENIIWRAQQQHLGWPLAQGR